MEDYPTIDLSHLLPAAQGVAYLPAVERIQRIRTDRWIGYPLAVEARTDWKPYILGQTNNVCPTFC